MSLAERFRSARLNAGLTQEQIAAAVGVDQSAISNLDRGTTEDPGAEMLLRSAELLQADPRYLLFGSGSAPPPLEFSAISLETEALEDQEAMLRAYLRLSASHKRA